MADAVSGVGQEGGEVECMDKTTGFRWGKTHFQLRLIGCSVIFFLGFKLYIFSFVSCRSIFCTPHIDHLFLIDFWDWQKLLHT